MVQNRELTLVHWDITKLLQMGVNETFINEMTEDGIKELLKGCLYLKERYSSTNQ